MLLRGNLPGLITVFFCISLAACEHDITSTAGGENQQATLSKIQSTIFSPRCAITGCHVDGGIAPMRLDTKSQSYASLVGIASVQKPSLQRVQTDEPDDSYLIHKIEGQPDILNQRMPPGGNTLSTEEIVLIRTWILEGAMDN
jgi:hypothetical protein